MTSREWLCQRSRICLDGPEFQLFDYNVFEPTVCWQLTQSRMAAGFEINFFRAPRLPRSVVYHEGNTSCFFLLRSVGVPNV